MLIYNAQLGRKAKKELLLHLAQKTKTNQKNPKKHLENPPKMYTLQGRHTLNDGGSHLRVSTRTTPSNSPL